MIGKALPHQTIFFLLSVGLLFLNLHLEGRAQAANYAFDHLGLEQGLPSLSVFAVAQDSRGFLWFGTVEGLCRYDGYSVKVYDRKRFAPMSAILDDKQGSLWSTPGGALQRLVLASGKTKRYMVGKKVWGGFVDSQGDFWAGTNGRGLVRYDRSNDSIVIYRHQPGRAESLCHDTVWLVYEDSKKELWIGTARGLERFDRETESFSHMDSLRSNLVQDMVEGSDHAFWIATDNGLCRFDPSSGAFSRYPVPSAHKEPLKGSVHEDRSGTVWVTSDSCIGWLDKKTHRLELLRDPSLGTPLVPGWQLSGILEDRKGALWFALDKGLAIVGGRSKRCDIVVVNRSDPHGLPSTPGCLLEDDAGNIWIGTFLRGVCMLDRNRMPFQHSGKLWPGEPELASAQAASILEDRSGILWVGSVWGFYRLDPATGSAKRYDLPGVSIEALLETRSGVLWLGTSDGLYQFETATEKLTRLPPLPEPSHGRPVYDSYMSLLKDRSGLVWTGGGLGNGLLGMVDPSTGASARYFVDDDSAAFGLPAGPIWSMHEDRDGTLWFTKGEIRVFDRRSGQARCFENPLDTLDNARRRDGGPICESSDGTLWFAVSAGLAHFNKNDSAFTYVGVKEGLPDTPVMELLEDDSGRREGRGKAGKLWLLTLQGLTRYNPSTGAVSHYGAADGVDIIPSDFRHSSFKNREGYLYFGGTNGFIRFHPDSVRDNTLIPPVFITSFKILNTEADLDSVIGEKKAIELSYRENVFSAEFAALNYVRPEKNQYAYKLEGFDRDWVDCGTRRTTMYTNLEPGSYVFRVKGSNNDGVWNEAGTSVTVIVRPPYWQTWWFKLLAAVAMAAVLVGFYRRKVSQLENEKRAREQFSRQQIESEDLARKKLAAELHDGLAQDLLVAGNELQRFLREEDGTKEELVQAASLLQESVQAVREISSNLHPHHLDRLGFVSAVEAMTQNLARSTSICICNSLDDIDGLLGKEAEIHLYRIFQEALTNVVRHASARNVSVTVRRNPETVEIIVTDDGKGFLSSREEQPPEAVPPAERLHGFGLASMKERARIIGAMIHVASSPGRGTSVHVTIPHAPGGELWTHRQE